MVKKTATPATREYSDEEKARFRKFKNQQPQSYGQVLSRSRHGQRRVVSTAAVVSSN